MWPVPSHVADTTTMGGRGEEGRGGEKRGEEGREGLYLALQFFLHSAKENL